MSIVEKVINFYPINGFNKTKEFLKIGDKKLRKIILENNLEKKSKVKIDFSDKKFIYTLGLLWSDGYINKNRTIGIECVEDDMMDFRKVLECVSIWSFYKREREFRPTINAYLNDKKMYDFLVENDYLVKSSYSPIKIYSKISKDMVSYFLLGIVDGDGCFYYNKKNYTRQFVLTSSIEQDWSIFERILIDIDVKYSIIRRVNKVSGYSQLRVTNKKDIIKIGEFIYKDMIVLNRKYESWKISISY